MWARALQRQERPGHGRPRILVPKGPRHSFWGRTVMIGWGGGQSCGLDHSPIPRGRSRSLGSRALKPNAEAAGARLGPRRSARVRGPLGQRPPSGAGPFGREAQLGAPPRLQRGTGKWGSRARIPKTTAEPTACTTPWGRAAASSTGTPPGQGLGSPERRPAQGRPPGQDPRNSSGTAPPPRARAGPPLVPGPRSRARRTDLRVPGRRICPGPRPRPQPSALRMSGWRGWNQIQPAER